MDSAVAPLLPVQHLVLTFAVGAVIVVVMVDRVANASRLTMRPLRRFAFHVAYLLYANTPLGRWYTRRSMRKMAKTLPDGHSRVEVFDYGGDNVVLNAAFSQTSASFPCRTPIRTTHT